MTPVVERLDGPYLPLALEAGRIHVCAHRGHSITTPENTLPAGPTCRLRIMLHGGYCMP